MDTRWLVALAMALVLTACAGKEKLTDDGRLIRDVDAFVAALVQSYEHRDAAAVMAAVSPQFAERDGLERSVNEAFARFDRIEMTVTVERIHLEGPTATVYTRWDGRWLPRGGSPILRQGTARFVVESGKPRLLVALLGDTPFDPAVTNAAP